MGDGDNVNGSEQPEVPVSALRAKRNKCTVGNNKHCWHNFRDPRQSGPTTVEYQEICCKCAPSWMRLVIPVRGLNPALIGVMNAHPIYYFEDVSDRVPTEKPGPKLLLPR